MDVASNNQTLIPYSGSPTAWPQIPGLRNTLLAARFVGCCRLPTGRSHLMGSCFSSGEMKAPPRASWSSAYGQIGNSWDSKSQADHQSTGIWGKAALGKAGRPAPTQSWPVQRFSQLKRLGFEKMTMIWP